MAYVVWLGPVAALIPIAIFYWVLDWWRDR